VVGCGRLGWVSGLVSRLEQVLVGADGGSAGGGRVVLTGAVHLAHNTFCGDADVRGVEEHDVAVFGDVVAEGAPAGPSGEGDSGEASEVEHFAETVAHQAGDVLVVVVVVQLIGARGLDEDGVGFVDSDLGESFADDVVNHGSGEGTVEVSVDRFDLAHRVCASPCVIHFLFSEEGGLDDLVCTPD